MSKVNFVVYDFHMRRISLIMRVLVSISGYVGMIQNELSS